MTQSRFFQLSLFFPFILWFVCLLVFSIVTRESNNFILNNLYDAYRVFVPYLIFAALIWKLARSRPYRLLMLMAFMTPIIWGVFFTFFYMVVTFIRDRIIDKWYILCIMAFWATVVAYLFEILPYLILIIFKDDFKADSCEQVDRVPLGHAPSLPES